MLHDPQVNRRTAAGMCDDVRVHVAGYVSHGRAGVSEPRSTVGAGV